MDKKILIIGCPGSGKSYLSKELSKLTGIPCFHIDNLYWCPDRTHITREELIIKYQDIFKLENFILEGNYQSSLEYRANFSNIIIFLDFALDECIKGIRERTDKVRDDIPWIQNEQDGEELIVWIKTFNEREKPTILEILNNFKGKIIILKDKDEVNEFLKRGIV